MRIFFLSLAGLYLVSCGQTTNSTTMSAQEAFETYVEALNAGDIMAAADFYDTADGFHWIERGRIQYETGQDAADSLIALQSSGGQSEMTLDTLRVSKLTSDSALISTHFDFVMRSENGTPQFSFDGWMTVGMVRRNEGWKIAGGQTGPGKSE